jgi:hypothetical protein
MTKLSPLKAVHKYCVWCVGGDYRHLDELCSGSDCPLYPYRHGKDEYDGKEIEIEVLGETIKLSKYSVLKAIYYRCYDCSAGDKKEIKNCPCYEGNKGYEPCPLWPFREGKNPYRKGIGKTENFGVKCLKNAPLNDEMLKKSPTEYQETEEKKSVNIKPLTDINSIKK